jgi:hypothetical protein
MEEGGKRRRGEGAGGGGGRATLWVWEAWGWVSRVTSCHILMEDGWESGVQAICACLSGGPWHAGVFWR